MKRLSFRTSLPPSEGWVVLTALKNMPMDFSCGETVEDFYLWMFSQISGLSRLLLISRHGTYGFIRCSLLIPSCVISGSVWLKFRSNNNLWADVYYSRYYYLSLFQNKTCTIKVKGSLGNRFRAPSARSATSVSGLC